MITLAPMAEALYRGLSGGWAAQLHMTAVLGTWGLRFLIVVLAVAPLARLVRRPQVLALRRHLGLIAFVYAAGHVLACLIVTKVWLWTWDAVAERPDFIPGSAALLVLILAAAVSTPPLSRRLDLQRRRRIQAWSLAAAPLAVLHYAMPVGTDVAAPYLYGLAAALLIGWRFWDIRRTRRPA